MSTFDYLLIGLIIGLCVGSAAGIYLYQLIGNKWTQLCAINENIDALRTLGKLRNGDVLGFDWKVAQCLTLVE